MAGWTSLLRRSAIATRGPGAWTRAGLIVDGVVAVAGINRRHAQRPLKTAEASRWSDCALDGGSTTTPCERRWYCFGKFPNTRRNLDLQDDVCLARADNFSGIAPLGDMGVVRRRGDLQDLADWSPAVELGLLDTVMQRFRGAADLGCKSRSRPLSATNARSLDPEPSEPHGSGRR